MRTADVTLWPEEAFNEALFLDILYERLGLKRDGSVWVSPIKRSIDARGKKVCVRFQCEIYDATEGPPAASFTINYPDVKNGSAVIIVGCGPAGLFAALQLIEAGYIPLIFERGKAEQSRQRDLEVINK